METINKPTKGGYTKNKIQWNNTDYFNLKLHVARATTAKVKKAGGMAKYIGACGPLRSKFSAKTITCKWSNIQGKRTSSADAVHKEEVVALHKWFQAIAKGIELPHPTEQDLIKYENVVINMIVDEPISRKPTSVIVALPSSITKETKKEEVAIVTKNTEVTPLTIEQALAQIIVKASNEGNLASLHIAMDGTKLSEFTMKTEK